MSGESPVHPCSTKRGEGTVVRVKCVVQFMNVWKETKSSEISLGWTHQDKNKRCFGYRFIHGSCIDFDCNVWRRHTILPSFILVFDNDRRKIYISRQSLLPAPLRPTCSHNLLNDSVFRKCCAVGILHPLCYSAFKFEWQKIENSKSELKRKAVGQASQWRTEPLPMHPHTLARSDFMPSWREDGEYLCL